MVIDVKESREVVIEDFESNFLNDAGNTSENNSVFMLFNFPDKICDKQVSSLTKKVMFKNKDGTTEVDIPSSGKVSLGTNQTKYPILIFQVCLSESGFLWKSFPMQITFAESLNYQSSSSSGDLSQAQSQLGEALKNKVGTKIESDYFDDITLPDFENSTFSEQVSWIENLKDYLGLAVDRVYDTGSETGIYDDNTMSWSLEKLFDFTRSKLATLKSSLKSGYMTVLGASTESELSEDEDYQNIVDTVVTDWTDFTTLLSSVFSDVKDYKDEMVSNANSSSRNSLANILTTTWNHGSYGSATFAQLIAFIEADFDEICSTIRTVTGIEPTKFSEIKAAIQDMKTSLEEALEEATGEEIENKVFSDLVEMVENAQSGGEVTPQSVSVPFSFTDEDSQTYSLVFTTDENGDPCFAYGE